MLKKILQLLFCQFLIILSLALSSLGTKPAIAVDFVCNVQLLSPTTINDPAHQPIKIKVTTTQTDGDPNWKYNWALSSPNGYQNGGLLGSAPSTPNFESIFDLGFLSFNGSYLLQIMANNQNGADPNFDHATCSGSPITFTVTGGTVAPTPTPPPSPPGDEPNCKMVFEDGSTGTKTIKNGDNITVKVIKTGTTNPYWGNTFVIKDNGTQVSEGPDSYTLITNQNGTYVFSAYLVITGVPKVEHYCSGGNVTVVINDTGTLGGLSGTNPCPGGSCGTAIGTFSTNPMQFVGQVLSIATGLAGGIAFILMVIGAIRVLTSTGNPQNVNAGRDMIIAALAGLIFIIFSVLILRFIGVNIFGDLNPFT